MLQVDVAVGCIGTCFEAGVKGLATIGVRSFISRGGQRRTELGGGGGGGGGSSRWSQTFMHA